MIKEQIDWERFKNPDRYPEYQSEGRCILAVNQHPYNIEYVKEPSEQLCILAVRKSAYSLEFIREEYQTETVCIEAINENPYAIRYIVKQTPNACIEALKLNWSEFMLDYIKIPIEGTLLKEINRLKLIKGPMKGQNLGKQN